MYEIWNFLLVCLASAAMSLFDLVGIILSVCVVIIGVVAVLSWIHTTGTR